MNLDVPEVAVEVGQQALRAMRAKGGAEIARRAMVDPAVRATEVGPLLERLGLGDLEDADDVESLMAAAELCRAAGAVALPYPVAARVGGAGGTAVAVIDGAHPRADHGTLFDRWLVIDQDGATGLAEPLGPGLGSRLGFFVADLAVGGWTGGGDAAARQAARVLTFQSATALGACQEALRLTVDHVRDRHQFGQPLADFQSVQFRLAGASTALAGLEELTRYTVVRLAGGGGAIVDVLGLRLQMITVSRHVMRTAHQLHGAIGFCDEHDLSMLTRSLQPLTRLPVDRPGTVAQLLAAVERYGFDATYPVPPFAAPAGGGPAG